MLLDAEFWVATAFVIFLGILGYAGGYRKVFDALDQRGARIKRNLDEARGLKQEAQALLREANQKQRDIEHEIEAIMNAARTEARRLIVEAKVMAEDVSRRQTALAETRIALAESQAVAEVRAAATEAAVSAAEQMLIQSVNGEDASRAFLSGIEAVKAKFGNSP